MLSLYTFTYISDCVGYYSTGDCVWQVICLMVGEEVWRYMAHRLLVLQNKKVAQAKRVSKTRLAHLGQEKL